MAQNEKLNWGILGAGIIAGAFAKGVAASHTGQVVAVGSRSIDKANTFADTHHIAHRHGSYEALLADADVQAIYVATPHPQHAQWAMAALEAGKHVLCEKPIGMNHAQAQAIIEKAREKQRLLMEAFMYRCHPQIQKVIDLIREERIGQVRMITASFGFNASGLKPTHRLFDADLGGGGILDVGCYPVSIARLIAGVASGQPFMDPAKVLAVGELGETKIDDTTAAVLRFPNGVIAQVATSVRAHLDNTVRITGSKGYIHLPTPFIPSREGQAVSFTLNSGGKTEEITVQPDRPLYALEADTFASALPDTQAASPAMSWDDTLGNMQTLDLWRQQIGLEYPCETPAGAGVLHGGALAVRSDSVMKYGRLPGVDKPISRFIMGCDNQFTYAHAAMIFDHWYEQGGNAFDTAYIYGQGRFEKHLGSWVKARNVRDKVVIITKGAHTPNCNPEALVSQLHESLDRQQTDHADIYIMHRDNLNIPVSAFIDVLNQEVKAGRIKVFGGSNWTLARIEEANAYAKKTGQQGMSLLSNNFSLAQLLEPIWPGCVACSDATSRQWLTENQFPVLAWSSQARGFFTERAGPGKTSDAELVRCWYSDENFKRRERAIELAKKKDVLPINIAAAYVLAQPFPTFALIGPRVLHELTTSLPGLSVELTADEVKWLNLED